MAIKLERGGGKALMPWPLEEEHFLDWIFLENITLIAARNFRLGQIKMRKINIFAQNLGGHCLSLILVGGGAISLPPSWSTRPCVQVYKTTSGIRIYMTFLIRKRGTSPSSRLL